MAAEHQYFFEDEVYRINKKGNIEFGMVLENSELISSDDSDVEEGGRMKKGRIRVAWHPTGIEEVIAEKKVNLADRSLMPGDVVRRMIKGKDTQRGYCRDIKVTACVQIVGTKQVIPNVKSENLVPLEEYAIDVAACLDSWVGGIKTAHSKLILQCSDGSRCVVNDIEACGLEDFNEKRDSNCEFPGHRDYFYPGQVLWGPLHCLEGADWIYCTKEMKAQRAKLNKSVKVVVEEVETDFVGVHWQCRAYSKDGTGSEKEQPKFLVQGDDLKRLGLLNVFEPCTLQVGDRNFYTIREEDTIAAKDQWRRTQRDLVLSATPQKDPSAVVRPRPAQNKNKEPLSAHGSPLHLPTNPDGQPDEEWDTEETASMSDSASVSSGCSSVGSQGRKKRGPALMTKVLKKKKLRRTRRKVPSLALEPGTRVVVETLATSSIADVVWQDGSVEKGILSTQLYPIHHLDDQEFFPGDFVIENRDEGCMRVYGVVQSVDHGGRTAKVRWFQTYTSQAEPCPQFLHEREVSVYDLKDHPDFQYRPGTVVIRVANFEGEDAGCSAGQVLDNYPEGQVRVWWVDGHVSMCWPQDLYKVGEYDSDEGELWDDGSSDGSWETESEDCYVADEAVVEEVAAALRPKLAANIEKARVAMSRLEEIFSQNPSLQTPGVMRQLLEVYRDCRYLDRLMGTTFFHESHFQGLLERVRERGRSSAVQRVADHVSRLFQPQPEPTESAEEPSGDEFPLGDKLTNLKRHLVTLANNNKNVEEEPRQDTVKGGARGQAKPPATRSKPADPDQAEAAVPVSNSQVCVRLCSLIKAQLVQAHSEVVRRFGGGPGLSEAFPPAAEQEPPLKEKVKDGLMDMLSALTRLKPDSKKSDSASSVAASAKEETESEAVAAEAVDTAEATVAGEGFTIMDSAPSTQKFKLTMFQPTDRQSFFRTVRKELKLLRTSLPPGIWVKGYEDRMDLYSVMIRGPEKTPYEDGLFLFDFQLSADYPKAPPLCHYISYCSDRLNPNLYEDGKVCVSLLGTWSGKGTEVWTVHSTLLQVIVSIQGLILVSEPYFNEAGYEKQKGSQQGHENSRMYNEMAVLKLVQSMTKLVQSPPAEFRDDVVDHFRQHAHKMEQRLESWLEISERYNAAHPITPTTPNSFRELNGQALTNAVNAQLPEFPLIPASKGFCLTLRKTLVTFRDALSNVGIVEHQLPS